MSHVETRRDSSWCMQVDLWGSDDDSHVQIVERGTAEATMHPQGLVILDVV